MPATVSALYSYPLKSGRRIPLNRTRVTPRGLEGDRMWMVVDADNRFITQRDQGASRLAQVRAIDLLSGDLDLSVPGESPVLVRDPHKNADADRRLVKIWNDTVPAFDAGDAAAEYITRFLGRPARIVRFANDHVRPSDRTYAADGDHTGFADGFSVLVTSESSLDALETGAGMERFRPNVVVRGLRPFEEDTIGMLQIGGAMFRLVKPCKRCPMPAINQDTGEYERETNPLPALNRLRKGEGGGLKGVFFGQNAVPAVCGDIRVGDEVTVIARREPHPAVAATALCGPA